jgi:hypothetical protein
MIDTVELAGAPLDPAMILAELVITHGRATVTDPTSPSSATLTILHPPGTMPTWAGGESARLSGPAGPLFTGRVTDRTLTHHDDPDGTRWGLFTVTAMGAAARLGLRPVGDQPWPQEPAAARATRILALSGLPHTVQAGPVDHPVTARDADATTARDLLDELAASTGAAVVDTPAGAVLFQTLSGRQRPVFPWRWRDFDPSFRWADFDPALTWAGDPPSVAEWPSPASTFPIALPPDAVEWEPEWAASEATVVNHVRLAYGTAPEGGEQPTVELDDPTSIARHGRRYRFTRTTLATEAAALDRAGHLITTQARDRWALLEVRVALDALDQDTAARLLGAVCGAHITIRGLPQPAPARDWTGILEGWTYEQQATDAGISRTLTLALSDPLHSMAVMRWADFPAWATWADFPAWATWDDLTDLPAIGWPTTPERTDA